jgi:hypothetical protein
MRLSLTSIRSPRKRWFPTRRLNQSQRAGWWKKKKGKEKNRLQILGNTLEDPKIAQTMALAERLIARGHSPEESFRMAEEHEIVHAPSFNHQILPLQSPWFTRLEILIGARRMVVDGFRRKEIKGGRADDNLFIYRSPSVSRKQWTLSLWECCGFMIDRSKNYSYFQMAKRKRWLPLFYEGFHLPHTGTKINIDPQTEMSEGKLTISRNGLVFRVDFERDPLEFEGVLTESTPVYPGTLFVTLMNLPEPLVIRPQLSQRFVYTIAPPRFGASDVSNSVVLDHRQDPKGTEIDEANIYYRCSGKPSD